MKTANIPGRLPPAFWCGLVAFAAAIGLGSLYLPLATVPLTLFILACLVAPFFPGSTFFLPVISRGVSGEPKVALTFDDGPDPASTPVLLALLRQYEVHATFFVTGRRAAKFPELIDDILDAGHTIGNHSYRHSYLALLRGSKELLTEITATQEALTRHGIRALAFRPPVGITTPDLGRILGQLGMYAVNFRFRPFDRGNRRLRNLARFILERVRPDDILILHDLEPAHDQGVARWLQEVDLILAGLEKQGLTITPLEELIARPVMQRTGRS